MDNVEDVAGFSVYKGSVEELMQDIDYRLKNKLKTTVVAINPEKVVTAENNEELKNFMNKATFLIPDGTGIVYASKKNNGDIKERITGIETMKNICKLASEQNYKVYLYGAEEKVVETAVNKLKDKFSNINIIGYSDGYSEENKVIEDIESLKPDIVFVALGSPKQERWIKKYINKLPVTLFQGVGGSFDVISGKIKRAPKWMQNIGLEWLYRLIKEPKRIKRQFKALRFFKLIN